MRVGSVAALEAVGVRASPVHVVARSLTGCGAAPAEYLADDVGESVLEVPVGHDVDDRIEGGVEVPDPEQDGYDNVRAGAALLPADGDGQVPGEEGQPAQQEGPHDYAQGDEGLRGRTSFVFWAFNLLLVHMSKK